MSQQKAKQYEACFKAGTVIRCSKRIYKAAWVVIQDGKIVNQGFSGDKVKASSAANAAKNGHSGRKWINERSSYAKGWLRDYNKKHGKQAYQKKVSELEKHLSIEIVEI